MTNPFACPQCGFDLQEDANEEVQMARIGQRRVLVTCPSCESVTAFTVNWEPTIVPESKLAIKVQKA